MSKTLAKYDFYGEFKNHQKALKTLGKTTRVLSKMLEVKNASSMSSKEIDEYIINTDFTTENILPEELNGLQISDPLNHYLLVRQEGKWKKIGVEDSGWIDPTLLNSWKVYGAGYPPAEYRKQENVVRLRGLVVGGASGTTLYQLLEGFRPVYETNFVGLCSAGGIPTSCYIRGLPTGEIAIFYTGSPEYFSMDGLTFTIN